MGKKNKNAKILMLSLENRDSRIINFTSFSNLNYYLKRQEFYYILQSAAVF